MMKKSALLALVLLPLCAYAQVNVQGTSIQIGGNNGGGASIPATTSILKGTASGNQAAPASYNDVVGLFGSGTCSGYLKSDGTCATGGGATISATSTLLKGTTAGNTGVAAGYGDVVALFGSGACTGYLKNDGTCATPTGAGPGGSTYDVQLNAGSSSFTGTSGRFTYNPTQYGTSQGRLSLNQILSSPGWNIGGTSGSWGPQMFTSDYPTKYSQGLWTMFSINNMRCYGNGDCNAWDMYWHDSGNWNDANGEHFTAIRNYGFIDEAAYVAPITGTANGNTQVTLNGGASSNAPNWGNGRDAIVQETAQAITITGASTTAFGGGNYSTLIVSGTPFTQSVQGSLSAGITITPSSSNPAVAESLSLTGVTGTGCAVNDLLTFLPNGSPGQLETVRVTSAGTLSAGAQTVGVNMRNTQPSGSMVFCHGTQGEYIDVPSLDYNSSVKLLSQVIGATANNTIIVAQQVGGSFGTGSIPTGPATLYGGAKLIDSTTPGTGQEDGNGFNVLSENNTFTSSVVNDHIEVADGANQTFTGYKSQIVANNPFLTGDHYYTMCPVGTACGDYQSGVNGIHGMIWINMNPSTSYNCPGCGGSWNNMPINYIQGSFGPLAYYSTPPDAPLIELAGSGGHNGNILQIDDAGQAAYWSWNKGSGLFTFSGPNFLFGGGGGGAGSTNITIHPFSGTITTCIGLNTSSVIVTGACPSSGAGGGGATITSPNNTITVGGSTSAPTVDLNLGHANTWTAPITVTGAPGLTLAAGTAAAGAVGKVVYGTDPTVGYAEVNENNTGLSRICTAANGACALGGAEVVTFSAAPTFSTVFNVSRIVLTGNITSFTLGAGTDGQAKTLCFAQDATGGRTVTAPANVHGFFTVGTTANTRSCQTYTYDQTDLLWLAVNTGVVNE